jgi:hypothetical protein
VLCHRGLAIADVNAAQAAVKSAYGFNLLLGPTERLALGSAVRKVAAAGATRASPAAGKFATAAKVRVRVRVRMRVRVRVRVRVLTLLPRGQLRSSRRP